MGKQLLEVKNVTTLVLKPGTRITIEYEHPDDVKLIKDVLPSDSYEEREVNMLRILHNDKRMSYLDRVVNMYMTMGPVHRMEVMDQLEWTKYSNDFFIRDFIAAVNGVWSSNKYQYKENNKKE